MGTHESGFLVFLIGFFLFYGVLWYRKNAPPSKAKSKKELSAALLGFTIEMVGFYMYDKLDSVMLVLAVITFVAIIWAGVEFLRYPKTTQEST